MAESEKIKKEVVIKKYGGGTGGAVYGLGMIGAAVYFIQHSATFMDGVIGLLKALVWPAFLIYRVFELLKF